MIHTYNSSNMQWDRLIKNSKFKKVSNKAGPSSTAGTVLAVPLLSLGSSKKLEKTEIFKSVTH